LIINTKFINSPGDFMAINFSSENFETDVLGSEQPVVIDFWSEG